MEFPHLEDDLSDSLVQDHVVELLLLALCLMKKLDLCDQPLKLQQ